MVDESDRGQKAAALSDADLAALYKRNEAFVRRLISLREHDPHKVDDLCQETWMNVWKSGRQLRDPDKFVSWITTVAQRVTSSHIRRQLRGRASQELIDAMESASSVIVSDAAMVGRLHSLRFVSELSDKMKYTFESLKEPVRGAAGEVGVKDGTLMNWRLQLRGLWAKWTGGNE